MFQKKPKLSDAPETKKDTPSPSDQKLESRVKPMTTTGGTRSFGIDNNMRSKPATYGGAAEAKKEGSKLHVGADIHLKGEITACDRLIVEGKVEASMTSKEIEISESGMFNGTVDIDTADISGKFDGTMKARKRLVIRKTGCVTGTISYGDIEIEPGGEIGGSMQKIAGEQPNLLTEMEKEKDKAEDAKAEKESV
ncbi:bactofilin family protein [Sneathiella litorea]|uniref:Polymer-forming cytoskeletal protein n=1 Tax=Sneathiella litorea TaxID=2606216 RepID=A0A6L8W5M4_9PROT|nr:polymer-forming cytoskeletal protein [Sneathiella litorea]MZR30019.1 polymer-forming cytoskeletal protein [Sneathiella litorea]